MKDLSSLLEKKKAALCILTGICALSVFYLFNSRSEIKEEKNMSFVVRIRHYGIDAKEIEKSITIPLEDALYAIEGIESIQSSSENSLSGIFIRFKKGGRGTYEAVRDAVYKVYDTLPSSVQRPEIYNSNNSRVPVWSAAVFAENPDSIQLLDRNIKPKLEKLDGAGEVIVSGVGNKQIFIILDQEKLESIGLDVTDFQGNGVASFLSMNDAVFSGGTILLTYEPANTSREIIVTVDGRYDGKNPADELKNALIPLRDGNFIALSDIAIIIEQEREPDTLSRLNGKKTAGIAVMGKDGADLRRLSQDIKKEIAALELPLEFIVLSDLGLEEAAAFRSVLNAAVSGALMAAIISFLLNINREKGTFLPGFFCALSIPLICLISITILAIIGFTPGRLILIGIAAGIGTAIDTVILCSERLRKTINYSDAVQSLKDLAAPLTAGAVTTVAALVPVFNFNDKSTKIIAAAIAIECIAALIISLTLLPPLLLWRGNSNIKKIAGYHRVNFFRRFNRLLALNIKFCSGNPGIVITISIFITFAAVFALFNKGADTSSYNSEDSLYAQVEFNGGLLSEEIDRLLASYSGRLSENEGIKNVETGARTGSGSLLISFDPKKIKAQAVRDLARSIAIPGGFVFFHENSNRERYWEIKIFGDEDKKCRELAEELARIISWSGQTNQPLIKDTVLNFKNGSKKLILTPDREIFAESDLLFSNAASKLRSGVYGPVAYKRMNPLNNNEGGETDVRIFSGSPLNINTKKAKEDVLNTLVSGRSGTALHIDTVMKKKEELEPSSIRRDDRRRTASITIITIPMDPRRVKKKMMPVFEKMELPPGYSIEFDPDAVRRANALSATVISLITAILFCYMVIASVNESFLVPLIVLSAIPPSLSVPALVLALTGSSYNLAIACAFIAVSGMTVNAAVLCVDSLNKMQKQNKEVITALNIYTALRKKMPALLATAITTIAGAIPFLFLKEETNAIIRTLSIVSALGITCSCLCSITVIPSIYLACARYKNRFGS